MTYFRTPQFWQTNGWRVQMLRPFGWIYAQVMKWRARHARPQSIDVPVICVGNLTMGGTGKTPVACAIAEFLNDSIFLTRGYGGRIKNPTWAAYGQHTAHDIGDEAFILQQYAPTVISQNRYQGALFALQTSVQPIEAIILDDGFQNHQLEYTISCLVVDAQYGFGNGYVFPAGPMREDYETAIKRADAVILLNDHDQIFRSKLPKDLPVFEVLIQPYLYAIEDLKDKKLIAFAGIAHPQKFFDMLESYGCTVSESYEFPDHYFYKNSDIEKILKNAQDLNAIVVTTEKDYVKIGDHYQDLIEYVPIAATFKDSKSWSKFLRNKINAKI